MYTVLDVVNAKLCISCGTCKSVCPNSAIYMGISAEESIYVPMIDKNKCTQCGMCLNVCPGFSIDFVSMNHNFFLQQPSDLRIGNFINCYLGHSSDRSIRFNSTSGGIVTQILIYLLDRGLINGALVTRMSKNKPYEPEPFLAKTKEEIIEAATSKYCPVPVNKHLKQILKEKGKYAVVGLPCHLHGIQKAEKILKDLKNKIYLRIGLVCSHTVNFNGTKFILKKKRIKKTDIKYMSYRGNGWPGKMMIKMKDNSEIIIPYVKNWNSYWPIFSSFFFTPIRCMMCPDITAEMSDISVGDAWLPELKHDKIGTSIIISRTKISENILNSMYDDSQLYINKIHQSDIVKTQKQNVKFKKGDLGNRLYLLKLNNKKFLL